MSLSFDLYTACTLCPRRCGVDRTARAGLCGQTAELRIARSALHYWEEPPISGFGDPPEGSGAIFFSGCNLRCVFCQNHEISDGGFGLAVSTERLAACMLELQGQGALNINLVTPTHYAPHVVRAVDLARDAGLTLPIVANTSGYELPEVVAQLAGVVDVWLTDYKYASSDLARRLSGAADYPQVAHAALAQMLANLRAAGGPAWREDGTMLRGIVVRHLVLPGQAMDSCAVLDRVWELAGTEVDLSIMNQYTPNERMRAAGGPMAGSVSEEEYDLVLTHADDLGFEELWWQQGGTVDESYIPPFDATGVEGPGL
jgi:putative pyruvate formate lyase activating enzyme